jgi:hypothetical protein
MEPQGKGQQELKRDLQLKNIATFLPTLQADWGFATDKVLFLLFFILIT